MPTCMAPTLLISTLLDEVAEPAWTARGLRLFYAVRLLGALLIATLVPLLIDRRLRR
jgi:hypothetical protein